MKYSGPPEEPIEKKSKRGLLHMTYCIANLHLVSQTCNFVCFRYGTKLFMIVAMISADKSCSFQVFLRSGLAVK